jgi:hypothetical protein
MTADELCAQGQKQFREGLAKCSTEQKRNELSLLFHDLISAVHRTDLERPLRQGYEAMRATTRREREREAGPSIETALKAAVGG